MTSVLTFLKYIYFQSCSSFFMPHLTHASPTGIVYFAILQPSNTNSLCILQHLKKCERSSLSFMWLNVRRKLKLQLRTVVCFNYTQNNSSPNTLIINYSLVLISVLFYGPFVKSTTKTNVPSCDPKLLTLWKCTAVGPAWSVPGCGCHRWLPL